MPVARCRGRTARGDRRGGRILVCTPECAGTLPGSFKNLLDRTVGGTEICDKPTAWINAAAPGRGEGAEAALRAVPDHTDADIVESACARIPVDRRTVGEDGLVTDPEARRRLGETLGLPAASGERATVSGRHTEEGITPCRMC
ncbi:hypothetical protein GCM10010377_42620 [Streptomyces viridiviolaceus]|uniref:NAD(P)H-dependent oxidoreductase n=1 Tax=Streptomyces viridiviolaceus TaxID=68282 RepID=UPI0019A4F5FA|nr:NAD(P)H-dependent oxidoreductase [Streptomyces viridiviolaceus]GHB47324.1 hypothetical protein GCM10010377_42620 [Streptomyces viridiviolaceus]